MCLYFRNYKPVDLIKKEIELNSELGITSVPIGHVWLSKGMTETGEHKFLPIDWDGVDQTVIFGKRNISSNFVEITDLEYFVAKNRTDKDRNML